MTKEELQVFCSEDREKLMEPFSIGDFTYASDGHICIRVPKLEGIKDNDPGLAKPVQSFFDGFDKENFVKAPLYLSLLPETRKRFIKCIYCSRDCPTCHCEEVCEECLEGTLVFVESEEVKISNVPFDSYYIQKIMNLTGFLIQESPAQKEAMKFIFDGGAGVLMPLFGSVEGKIKKYFKPKKEMSNAG